MYRPVKIREKHSKDFLNVRCIDEDKRVLINNTEMMRSKKIFLDEILIFNFNITNLILLLSRKKSK